MHPKKGQSIIPHIAFIQPLSACMNTALLEHDANELYNLYRDTHVLERATSL